MVYIIQVTLQNKEKKSIQIVKAYSMDDDTIKYAKEKGYTEIIAVIEFEKLKEYYII